MDSGDLKRGSVKRADIANRAVNSAKVADNSLSLQDFKATERNLLVGPQGPQGPQGAEGQIGPSETFYNERSSALTIPVDARLRLAAWLGRDLAGIWRILEGARRRLTDSRGGPVTSFERFREEIGAAVPQFAANVVPDLLRFGLLEEEP